MLPAILIGSILLFPRSARSCNTNAERWVALVLHFAVLVAGVAIACGYPK